MLVSGADRLGLIEWGLESGAGSLGLIDWGLQLGSGADRLGSGADIILRLRSEAGRLGLGSGE